MKRSFLSLIFICILLFTSVSALAEGAPKVTCDNISCNSGETVSYAVHISGNTGMGSFLIGIGCESDWLYFDETAEQGDFTDKGSMETSGDARRLNVLWYDVDGVSDDGTLFTVNVHVSPSAPSGDYPIEIAYSPENTLDADCNELALETAAGCISVTHVDAENIEDVLSAQTDGADNDGRGKTLIGISAAAAIAAITITVLVKTNKTKREEKK